MKSDSESNAKVDQLIRDIAESYISEVGWADVLDTLKVLEKVQPRISNSFEFTGNTWIGVHLLSVLQDMVDEQALAENRCGSDGAELVRKEEKQTRDYPGYEWLECPVCHEQYPVRG